MQHNRLVLAPVYPYGRLEAVFAPVARRKLKEAGLVPGSSFVLAAAASRRRRGYGQLERHGLKPSGSRDADGVMEVTQRVRNGVFGERETAEEALAAPVVLQAPRWSCGVKKAFEQVEQR